MHQNELEMNLQTLVDAKAINLEVTLGTIVKAGGIAGLDPWDVFCGNGWILRRRGPWPGPFPRASVDAIREVLREELAAGVSRKG